MCSVALPTLTKKQATAAQNALLFPRAQQTQITQTHAHTLKICEQEHAAVATNLAEPALGQPPRCRVSSGRVTCDREKRCHAAAAADGDDTVADPFLEKVTALQPIGRMTTDAHLVFVKIHPLCHTLEFRRRKERGAACDVHLLRHHHEQPKLFSTPHLCPCENFLLHHQISPLTLKRRRQHRSVCFRESNEEECLAALTDSQMTVGVTTPALR